VPLAIVRPRQQHINSAAIRHNLVECHSINPFLFNEQLNLTYTFAVLDHIASLPFINYSPTCRRHWPHQGHR
jgi:hypothetical protein